MNGLLKPHNTPRPDGFSSAVVLLGRPLHSLVPTHRSAFNTKWHDKAKKIDEPHSAKDQAATHYDAHAKSLSSTPLGTDVCIQNHITERIIVGVGRKRDRLVKTPSGSIY